MTSAWGIDHGDEVSKVSRKTKENSAITAGVGALGGGAYAAREGAAEAIAGHVTHAAGSGSWKKSGATAARGLKMISRGNKIAGAGAAGAALGAGALGVGIGSKIKNRKRG